MGFKIYTKTGDAGHTGLYGGKRVSKDHVRIDAYGTVDELNSHVGMLIALLAKEKGAKGEVLAKAPNDLLRIQSELFTVGSQLATPPEKELSIVPVGEKAIRQLEMAIDSYDEVLPQLTSFILPSGNEAISQAHICRTVTRRAERVMVALNNLEAIDTSLLMYMNRLSDYFFTLSRAISYASGVDEQPWLAER